MRSRMRSGLLLLLVTLGALAAVLWYYTKIETPSMAARLSSCMVSASELEAITVGRTADETLLDGLQCNGYTLPRVEHSLYYSIVAQDADAMNPVFTAVGLRAVRIAVQTETLDADFVSLGQGLPFVVYTDSTYAVGALYITTLPVISIQVTQPDSAGSYEVTDRTERGAEMLLFDNRAELPPGSRLVHSQATIRVRGASSSYLPKQSYRLKLSSMSLGNHRRSNQLSLLGLRQDDDWILYAAGNDSERIRNSFSNNLWYQTGAFKNAQGVCLGVECRYVELILNGQYMGLYALMYPLDEKQLALPSDSFYYRAISYADTTVEMLQEADNETVIGAWEFRGPRASDATGYDRWACLTDYLSNTGAGFDDDWCSEKLDSDNIIHLFLFLSLIQGEDNYIKNNNVIAYPNADGTYHYLLAPWDLDLTWGNRYSKDEQWLVSTYDQSPTKEYHAWALPADFMLNDSAALRAQLLSCWQELRTGDWSDQSLMTMLDGYEADIYSSGAMARERECWPTSPTSENLDRFREYCLTRLAFLDQYFEEAMHA